MKPYLRASNGNSTSWVRLYGVTVSLALTATAAAELPGAGNEPPVPVIDVHAHVFNGHDLPLAGILNARGVPLGISASLAKVLNALTKTDDLNGPIPFSAASAVKSAGAVPMDVASTLLDRARATAKKPGAAALFDVLDEKERAELLEYAGASGSATRKSWLMASPAERDLDILADLLARADFPPGESEQALTTKGAGDLDRSGYVEFIRVMTEGHLQIAAGLAKRQYPAVDLFVHHMMDLEKAYDTKTATPFPQQIERMTRLDQRFDGKFIHFVAFDPFRRSEALPMVRRGLEAGAVGVKFYPPSGYRASGNACPDYPEKPWILKPGSRQRWVSRYEGLDGAALDALNEGLFAHCEANDIPIFTHCTPQGFEADDDYGEMANPKYWKPVLERHKKLRLCFGHSGGHAFWFPTGQAGAEAMFGAQVVELCLQYPNVYCEVGYLDQILDPRSREKFKARFKEQVDRPSYSGGWKFGDKIMYGSDWHMIHKEKRHEEYPAAFNELFTDPVLKPWQRAFFCRNAIAYLKLQNLANDPRASAAQKKFWQELLAKASASPK